MPRLTAVLFGLMLMLCGTTLLAQSTSGTLATTDDSFTHPGSPMVGSAGGPRRYRAIEFNVVTTGNYTFTYTPSGYTGALYLYQGAFLPASPIANIWTFGNTGSPVVVTHNLSVTGKFVVVLTSTANNASGSWTLGITGPGTLEMGPVVNSCAPTSGSTGGGTNATLTGSFFTGVNNVTFGGTAVTNLTVVNDTTITCTTPSHAAGSVTIRASKPAGFGLAGERFNSFTYNLTPTSVSSINRQTPSGTTTNASSVVFRVTFAASAGGLTSSNFDTTTTGSVAGESVASVSGSGTIWDVTVNTGSGDGTVRLDMINDNGVNPSLTNVPFTSGQTYTIDKTAPVVSSIVRAAANPSNATSVTFTVTFSETVSGVTTGNFSVDATGPSGASITGISGTGATRTVTVSTGTGDGTLSVDLLNSLNNITDNAGNTMSSAFVSGEAYTIDKTAPGVSIGAPSVSSTSTGPVSYTITYTGADTVTLTGGNVTLNTTGTATGSVAVSGSGTATRTVTISSITGDGTIGISIAKPLIRVADAVRFQPCHTASENSGAAGPSTTFAVSGLPGISIGAPSATLVSGGPVDFVVTYTNATAVSLASGDVTLNTTGTVAGSVAVTGTGTATRTVTVSSITGDGSFTISIAANTASNGAGDALAAGPSASVDVDNTDPGLTPGGTVTVSQGTTSTGATVGTVSDNLTAAGNLGVAATTVPTGLVVNNITNTGGNVTADMEIAREEIFGPVATFLVFDTMDEAIDMANDSSFGLAAKVWPSSRKSLASRVSRLTTPAMAPEPKSVDDAGPRSTSTRS